VAQDIAWAPLAGESYTFSVWVRSSGNELAIGSVRLWGLGGTSEFGETYFVVGPQWTLVTAPLDVANSGHTSMRAEVYMDVINTNYDMDGASLARGNARDEFTTYVSYKGSDRYWTAIYTSQIMFPGSLPTGCGLVLAPGETFQEALCGAPLASAYGGPILLTPAVGLNNAVKNEMQRLAPKYVFCIGLSSTVVNAVKAALPGATVTAINGSGGSVYDMSRKVANALKSKAGSMASLAIITRGDMFPDAIAVSPLACAHRWPVILTNKGDGSPLHPSAIAALSDLGITQALKVGTYATLPAGVGGVGNCSGSDRYYTNRNVVEWSFKFAQIGLAHVAFTTGDKFPDALAAGPYLAQYRGLLFLSPLNGPVPPPIVSDIIAHCVVPNHGAIHRVSFIACIQPVIGQVVALLP
jgi:hypothetical protein